MKKIKSQAIGRDFQDVDVRRLSGALEDARHHWTAGIEQIGRALQRMEELKEAERNSGGMQRISLEEIRNDLIIDEVFDALRYIHQMVPNFGDYFDSGF